MDTRPQNIKDAMDEMIASSLALITTFDSPEGSEERID